MNKTGEALRQLHRIHRQLTDLRERLGRGPKQIHAGESNVKCLEENLTQSQQDIKAARIAADQKQLQLKVAEDRIEDLKGKLNACGSNREYQALREQIAADEMATSVLADEILETLEKIDQYEESLAEATATRDKAGQELEKLKVRVNEERKSLELDLARLTGELKDTEATLPAEFKVDYDRIVKARGEETLAQVDGNSCGGCYQMITSQMLNELHLSRPVFCKSCGRLLYFPENRTVGEV